MKYPYWRDMTGCCDCKYGKRRGQFSRQTNGALGMLFECTRSDKPKYTRPNDTCEHYEYCKETKQENIQGAEAERL